MLPQPKLDRQPVELLQRINQLLRRLLVRNEDARALRHQPPCDGDAPAKPAKAGNGDSLVLEVLHDCYPGFVQSSTRRPGTWRKSARLRDSNSASLVSAIAA